MFRLMCWCLWALVLTLCLASSEVQMRPSDSHAIIAARQDFARIEQVWAPYLKARGITTTEVRLHFVAPARTAQPCGRYNLYFVTRNATACQGLDGIFYVILPIRYAADLYGGEYGGGQLRKVPARALLAHEYGHIVQYLLMDRFSLLLPKDVQQEQLADCQAGAAINGIYGFRWSLPGNDTVSKWYDAIGDPEGVRSHGTTKERHNAFDFGYGVGMYGVTYCFQKFWPNVIGL